MSIYRFSEVWFSLLGGFGYDGAFYNSLEDATQRLLGGFVVCERKDEDDRPGRLRLHKLYAPRVSDTKNGWLDLFTYTRKDESVSKKGFYICRILEVRQDRNGYVNLVVEALVFLGETITKVPENFAQCMARILCWYDEEEDLPVWEYLRDQMSPIAFARGNHYTGDCNFLKASELISPSEAMKRLLDGEVSILDDISKALLEPTDMEKAIVFIQKEYYTPSFKERYPLLAKKGEELKRSQLIELLERKLQEFEAKGLTLTDPAPSDPVEILLSKAEAALRYWKEINKVRKLAQKEAEKAAKKAAKLTA